MSNDAQRKPLITDYLLGRVTPEKRAEFEERYLNDDDLFEEVVAAENDMIDAYVRGELAAPEQKLFETYFLISPERQERVQFARSLMSHAPGAEAPVSGWQIFHRAYGIKARLALATVVLLAVVGFSWMLVANQKLRHQLDAAQARQAEAQRQAQQLRQTVADLQEQAKQNTGNITDLPAPGAVVLSLALVPDLSRSTGQQQSTLHLAAGISEVRLLLSQAHDGNSTYSAVLETVEGRPVWRKDGLAGRPVRNGGGVIVVQMPPSVLNRDDYVFRLFRITANGKAEVGTYSFRVVK